MRAAILAACLMTAGSLPVATARWSDPATWGGAVPTFGPVVVMANQTILLDVQDTSSLGTITVLGTVVGDLSSDLALQSNTIIIGPNGLVKVGTPAQRYERSCILTMTGAKPATTARFIPQVDSQPAGTGRVSVLAVGTGVVAGEIITLTFTSSTAFTASSSTAGAMASGTVGTYYSDRVQFRVKTGTTAWAAGNVVVISAGIQYGFNVDPALVNRNIVVQPGGKLQLYGKQKTGYVHLNANAAAGATTLTVDAAPVGWAVGDEIAIGPTDYYDTAAGKAQRAIIAGISGTTITLHASTPLAAPRWGQLQYPTDAGISLTPGAFTTGGMKASADVPTVIDQRARITNLSRSIVIQGANDSAWTADKWGVDVMVMGLASDFLLDQVQVRRCGKAGVIGRYPVHFHMLSYGGQQGGNMGLPSDGTFLGQADPAKHAVTNCSIHDSSQRAIVIHGTQGAKAQGNVISDVVAHAVFMEDNVEEFSTITGNTVFNNVPPLSVNALTQIERPPTDYRTRTDGGLEMKATAGFWLSHPNITFTDNYAAGCEGAGVWNAPSSVGIGLCGDVVQAIPGMHTEPLSWARNEAHCCGFFGMMTRGAAHDSRGENTNGSLTFAANTFYTPHLHSTTARAQQGTFVEYRSHHCSRGAYHNAVNLPIYLRWTISDTQGPGLSGNAQSDLNTHPTLWPKVKDSLGVGRSLNNPTAPSTASPYLEQVFMVSYHAALVMDSISLYSYPSVTGTAQGGNIQTFAGGGGMRSNDFYLNEPERQLKNGGPVKLHGSGMGWVTPPLQSLGGGHAYPGVSLTASIYDPFGYWANTGETLIYNDPFLTAGVSTSPAKAGAGNWLSTPAQYCGIGTFYTFASQLDPNAQRLHEEIVFTRQDASGATLGTWTIPAVPVGQYGTFDNMRHASVVRGGRYKIAFTGRSPDTKLAVIVQSALAPADTFVFGVPIAGTTAKCALMSNAGDTWETIDGLLYGVEALTTAKTNLADVTSSSTIAHWLDTSTHTLWIKHIGGGIRTDSPSNDNNNYTYYIESA
jgi:hypothetical protein